MQAFTAGDALAIMGRGRGIRYIATFAGLAGGPIPVDGFKVDGGIKDIPDQINNLAGVASRQATFTVSGSAAASLSPYIGLGVSAKIGTRVQVAVQVNGGSTFPLFTGSVSGVQLTDLGDATVTALDDASLMGGQFTISAAANVGMYSTYNAKLDGHYSPLAPIALALRSGGVYLTLPPLIANAGLRDRCRVLSVPGVSGALPEVGTIDYDDGWAEGLYSRMPGKFGPEVVLSSAKQMVFGTDISQLGTFTAFVFEGWVYQGAAAGVILNMNGAKLYSNSVGSRLLIDSLWANNFGIVISSAWAFNAWHYVYMQVNATGTRLATINVNIDGVATTVVTNGPAPANTNTFFGVGGNTDLEENRLDLGHPSNGSILTASFAWESVEAYLIQTGDPVPVPSARPTVTAPASSAGIIVPATRLPYVAPVPLAGQWETVQSISQADGALAFFDESGLFNYLPRRAWLARRLQAPVRTFGDADISEGLTINLDSDGLFSAVWATYRVPAYQGQRMIVGGDPAAVGSPIRSAVWDEGTTFLEVPASGTTVLRIDADVACIGASTPSQWRSRGLSGSNYGPNDLDVIGARSSWYAAVRSTSLGDPAATPVSNLRLYSVPTESGFKLTVTNPNPYAVTFWTPAYTTDSGQAVPQGSGLRIAGFPFSLGVVQTATRKSNPQATSALAIEDNPWRQDAALTDQMVSMVAGDVFAPIPDISGIVVPGDPRLQVGDLISVYRAKLMAVPVLALVVEFEHLAPVDGPFESTLSVRPIGPPGAWLLGVPGRSTLGSTTTLASY